MKKLLSIILALVLVLSMSAVAFAENEQTSDQQTSNTSTSVEYKATDITSFNEIVKTYTSENNVVVNETLSFTSTASTSNPDQGAANLTVADLTVNSLNPGTLTVTIPSLSVAGTYEWTIKETAGNTAGVTYSTAEVHVIVLVEYDNENHELVIGNKADGTTNIISYIKKEDGTKAKTFENTFKSGSFTVAKDVIGNMANENDEFEISVTLTSTKPIGTNVTLAGTTVAPSQWTTNYEEGGTTVKNYIYTKTLNYSEIGGPKTFADIPTGVTVTVTEKITNPEKNLAENGYTYVGTYTGRYETTDTSVTGTEFTGLIVGNDTADKITVVNRKNTSVETGIALDSMPYVLMLAVACVGLILIISKKRTMREN